MDDLLRELVRHYKYVIYAVLMVIGLYAIIAKGHLVKKIIGLNLLQTAVFLFYLSIGRVKGGTVPVIWEGEGAPAQPIYENPVPHVLMLTAIVVGVSVTAVALALVVRIQRAYGTVEEVEILAADEDEDDAQGPPPDVAA
ncbi:MAG: cation:proton antiporter subunit C [Planctomycetota bacterium]